MDDFLFDSHSSMKKLLITIFIFPSICFAQFANSGEKPYRWQEPESLIYPSSNLTADKSNIEKLVQKEDGFYACATVIPSAVGFDQFVLSDVLANGDKLYQYIIQSDGALGLRVQFDKLKLSSGSKLWLYNPDKTEFVGPYTASDVQNQKLMSSIVHGNSAVIMYLEPRNIQTNPFRITEVRHFFRGLKSSAGFRNSQSCMLNVRCPEGDNYALERDAVCRILVSSNSGDGWCTGTLMNNTLENASPIILTANHCRERSTFTNFANWEFHFFYQGSTCSTPFSEPDFYRFRSCDFLAATDQDYGSGSSDFLLLRLKGVLPDTRSTGFEFTLMGWDRSGAAPRSGVGIHHPEGDIKKISTYVTQTTIQGYEIPSLNTHYKVNWASTGLDRYSVTQGGSSGSGLLNTSKLLVGTLTGGASACTTKTEPDFYGRLSSHWRDFGSANTQRLDVWLDPAGLGANTLRTIRLNQANGGSGASVSDPLISRLDMNLNRESLDLHWQMSDYSVRLFDAIGRPVIEATSIGKDSKLNISSLSAGIYIVQVSKNEIRYSKKIHIH
jgi:hypothetical protein